MGFFKIPYAFLVASLVLLAAQATHSLTVQELTLACKSDADCAKQTPGSICSHNLCICLMGYQPQGAACVQKNCTNSTECNSVFGNTTCVKLDPTNVNSTGHCECDLTHFLDHDTQTCSLEDTGDSLLTWFIGIGVLVFLAILFTAVFFLYKQKSKTSKAQKPLLESQPNSGSGGGEEARPNGRTTTDYQSISQNN